MSDASRSTSNATVGLPYNISDDEQSSKATTVTPELGVVRDRTSTRRTRSRPLRDETKSTPGLFDIFARTSEPAETDPDEDTELLAATPKVDERFRADWTYLELRLMSEEFEFGRVSETEQLLENLIRTNPNDTRVALNKFYIRYFPDPRILTQILHLISRVDHSTEFSDLFELICLACFAQGDDEVKELAVRCFEAWATPDCLRLLEGLHAETQWLRDYIDAVIRDLRISYGVLS